MKKTVFLFVFVLVFTLFASGEDIAETVKDIDLGKINFPRAFVHDGKDYNRGVYKVTLKEKEGEFIFNIFNQEDELLFEEFAIVKKFKSRNPKFKFRVRKGILKGYEYFRIRVTKPDKKIFGFFLLKKNITKKQ